MLSGVGNTNDSSSENTFCLFVRLAQHQSHSLPNPHNTRDTLSLAVGATTARQAVAFPLAVRAGVAVRAVAFPLPVRAGVARCAVAFHPAVRAGAALLAAVFPPAVRASL